MDDLHEEPALGATFSGDPIEAFVGDEPGLPASADGPTYRDYYAQKRRQTTTAGQLGAMLAAIVFSGAAAVVGTFIGSPFTTFGALGFLAIVTIGPAVEEVMKIAGVLYLAERRPWLIPSWRWPVVIAAASGLVFAAIENILYINVYFPNEGAEFATLRWTVGPALHITTAVISSIGVSRMWSMTHTHGAPPSMAYARPFLITAAVIHGLYNLTAIILEAAGLI